MLDDTLVALADPKRRAILRRLAHGGEVRVSELAAPFGVSLNAVSKHIKLLERGGLVQRRRLGREHLIRFNPESLNEVQDWISKQKAFWQSSLEVLDDLLQQEDKAENISRKDQT